jgi:tyrosyl-tRNA synthetase
MTFDLGEDTSLTKDHVIPKAFGGSDEWENLVAACQKCNKLRDTMDAFLFLVLLTAGKIKEILAERRRKNVYENARLQEKSKSDKEAAWRYHKLLMRAEGRA